MKQVCDNCQGVTNNYQFIQEDCICIQCSTNNIRFCNCCNTKLFIGTDKSDQDIFEEQHVLRNGDPREKIARFLCDNCEHNFKFCNNCQCHVTDNIQIIKLIENDKVYDSMCQLCLFDE